jgi:hypothetical protein
LNVAPLEGEVIVTQSDYLLRLIETVGEMLIRLRKMLLGQEIGAAEAYPQIYEAAEKAGLDLDFICSVHDETLVMLMSPTGEVEPGRCWITAELLMVDGVRCREEGDLMGALARFNRSLLLYRLIDPDAVLARGFPEVRERIEEVETWADELVPDDLRQ